jgi:hypothetical protein
VIKRLEPYEAYETLGVFLAPDGNLGAQIQKMKKAAVKWADNLCTGSISNNEVWVALQSTILRTLAYPLPALRLTKKDCEEIMAPIFQYCLPALGVCRHFPQKLVYSTLDYLGLNIQHLFYLQEIARIKDIILHTFNDTLMGRLYRASMELFFLELGISPEKQGPPPSVMSLLTTPSLVQSTLIFLAQHNIVLKHSICYLPQREHDLFIMEGLISANISLNDLLACNHCRMYLQVAFLSDIVTGDGLLLLDDAWLGRASLQTKTNL